MKVTEKTIMIDISGDEEFGARGHAFFGKGLPEMSRGPIPATPSASQVAQATSTCSQAASQVALATPSVSRAAIYAATVISPGRHEVEVFRTKVSPFGPTKFIYVEDAATISDFLETVRKKWALSPLSRATGIRVFIDGQEFCIDITDERGWAVVRGILRNGSGCAGVLVDLPN
jgi:hypothetical protein